jgi:hypothetical protein
MAANPAGFPCVRDPTAGPTGRQAIAPIVKSGVTIALNECGGPEDRHEAAGQIQRVGPLDLGNSNSSCRTPNLTVCGHCLSGGISAGAGRLALRMPQRFALRFEPLFEPEPQPPSGSQANRLTGICPAANEELDRRLEFRLQPACRTLKAELHHSGLLPIPVRKRTG